MAIFFEICLESESRGYLEPMDVDAGANRDFSLMKGGGRDSSVWDKIVGGAWDRRGGGRSYLQFKRVDRGGG